MLRPENARTFPAPHTRSSKTYHDTYSFFTGTLLLYRYVIDWRDELNLQATGPPLMASPVPGLHHMQQLLQQHVLSPNQLQQLMKQHSLLQQQHQVTLKLFLVDTGYFYNIQCGISLNISN